MPGVLDSISMFFIYGFMGWVIEVVYYGISGGKFINRGFLNGPICPLYGNGFYGVIIILTPFLNNFTMLFFGSMAITTLVELIAGIVLYKVFQLRWWDYSQLKFNLKGFICLRFSIYWGIACTLGLRVIQPAVMRLLNLIPDSIQTVIVGVLSVILIADIIATVASINNVKRKIAIIMNISDEIRSVSDSIGNKIYGGVEMISSVTAPTRESYMQLKEMTARHRNEERELAKKNREEELKVFSTYIQTEKASVARGRDAANEKLRSVLSTVKKSEKRLVESIAVNGSDASKIAYRLILNIKDATYERVVRSLSRTPSDTILDSDDITEDSTDRKGNT